ncbi:MAG: ABC transporter permease [Solirubrobacterales bacterium]|nr:ABC transporter permease [Solirubrobacterales bacterium]
MKLSSVRYIYEGHIGARSVLVQLAFATFGISVGVALLFSSQVSSTSLSRSVTQLNTQLVGASQLQLDARGPEGFSEGVLEAVRHEPGVRSTFPILERQVNVIGEAGERSVDLIGVDPAALRSTVPLLHRFSAKLLRHAKGVALPGPLASEINAGPLIKLQIGGRLTETLLGPPLTQADVGGLVHSPVAVTSINYAQHLTNSEHRLTRIFIRYRKGQGTRVRRALAGLATRSNINLNPGNFDSQLFAVAVSPESQSEQLFSAISALVGFMFALNAMLVTIPARRKLVEDLREQGASPRITVQVLLFDAFIIGVLACALGLVIGDALSIAVFRTQPGYLSFAFPVGNDRIVAWQSMAIAVVVGVVAAVAGVLWPVRQILARRIGAPRQFALSRRTRLALLIAGMAFLALTTLVLLADTRAAVIGNATLIAALVCLLPLLFDGLLRLFAFTSRFLGGVGASMAVDELRAPQTRVRSLAVAALAAVSVFGVVEFQGVATNLKRGLDASAHDLDSSADVWITPRGSSSLLSTVTFDPIDTAALAHVPGVRQVSVYRGSFLDWGTRRLWVIAPARDSRSLVPSSQLLSSRRGLASRRLRAAGWALLSQALASEYHLRVGQTFTLPSPRPLRMRLAGVTTNLGWPPGAVLLNATDYARGWEGSDPSAYEIQAASGTSLAAVRSGVAAVLGSQRGLAVETAGERAQRHYALAAQGLARLTQIRRLVLTSAILAIVAAMASLLWQRRDRIAFNRSNGLPQRVLWRSLVCESAVLLGAGSLIGAIFGLYAQLLGSHFLSVVTGFPIVFTIEGVAAISGFALVSVVAVAILAVPGYLAVRVRARSVSPAY